jgi:F0F1-type ATP synthase assembly protein I
VTESTDNPSSKPISVAELLAKNGTIGAPPAGGRRRRRRGDTDSISVAELTGEIPIYTTGELPVYADEGPEPEITGDIPEITGDIAQPEDDEPELLPVRRRTPDERARGTKSQPVMTQAELDYAEHVERRRLERDAIDFVPPARRTQTAPVPTSTGHIPTVGSGAEEMVPDPAEDEAPSYVRTSGKLFGGQQDDDDLGRGRQSLDEIEHVDEGDDAVWADRTSKQSGLVAGVWIIGQCILAVALGAGLFIAFDQLWQWNNIVALVLSVLVILGLVVGVRVVRKTEDIASTLIAVAVGAMVTLGPLVLLRSH